MLSLFSETVYRLLGASSYASDINYFYWLLFAEGFRVCSAIFLTYLSFKLRQHYILFALAIVSGFNFCLNMYLVPKYGALGAAVSTFICYFVYFLTSLVIAYIPERRYFSKLSLK